MKHYIRTEPNAKRAVGRKLWNLFSKLPHFIRGPLVRRLFSVPESLPPNLIFKKAETPEELEQAFQVAYEGYRQRGLVEDLDSRLRITKYHALPTTTILIAKEDDQVIATITIVVDSAIGLPLEKLWSMEEIRKSSARIAEISTLSIRKDHRSRRGRLLLPLMGFMHKYCVDVLGVDKIVASVHPEVADFYRCVLLFKMFKEVKTYDFVQGAAAVAGWLSLTDAAKNYKKVYANKPRSRNLHYFFFEQPMLPNYKFAKQKYKNCSDFNFTPALLEYFFKDKTKVISELTSKERNVLSNLYFHEEFTSLINANALVAKGVERNHPRFAVSYSMRLTVEKSGETVEGKVLDVSSSGLRVRIPSSMSLEGQDGVHVFMDLGNGKILPLRAIVAWNLVSYGQLGLQLHEFVPREWYEFISHFESALDQKVASNSAVKIAPAK